MTLPSSFTYLCINKYLMVELKLIQKSTEIKSSYQQLKTDTMKHRTNYPNEITKKYFNFLVELRKITIGVGFTKMVLSELIAVHGCSKALTVRHLNDFIETNGKVLYRWKGEYVPTMTDAIKLHKAINKDGHARFTEQRRIKAKKLLKLEKQLNAVDKHKKIAEPEINKTTKKRRSHSLIAEEKAGVFIKIYRYFFYNPYGKKK